MLNVRRSLVASLSSPSQRPFVRKPSPSSTSCRSSASMNCRMASERSADDAVVRRHDATGYAELLIRLADRLVAGPAQVMAMANRRDLPVRVRSVLDGSRRRDPAGRRAVVIAALAVFVVVIGTAPLTATLGAQSAPLPTAKFDVASIRACQPPPQQPGSAGEGSHSSPGRLSTGCVRLLDANDIGLISD